MRNKYIFVFYLLILLLGILPAQLPFFWDGCFFSEAAVNFYNNGFHSFVPPLSADTGGFPLFSVYLAFCWKIFGKSLLIAHLSMLPILFLLFNSYQRLAAHFLKGHLYWFALVLFFADPVLITQAVLMGYDILLAALFLAGLNALLKNKTMPLMLFISLLLLTNVRGIVLGSALFFIHVYVAEKRSVRLLLPFMPGTALLAVWLLIHREQTGWLLFSPMRSGTAEVLLSPGAMLKQAVFIAWKVADLGRIVPLLIIAAAVVFQKKTAQKKEQRIRTMSLILLLLLCLSMIPWSNPVGPKYFLSLFLLLQLATAKAIEKWPAPRIQYALFFACTCSLVAGNFYLYPLKYGNAWDSSLKVLPYFALEQQMHDFIQQKAIPADSIGTQFPLISDQQYSHLKTTSFAFENVWQGPVEKFPYILYSNVINSDIPEQFERVRTSWQPVKLLRSGMVQLELYRRP